MNDLAGRVVGGRGCVVRSRLPEDDMKDRKGHKGKRLAHEKVSDAELRRIVKDQTWSHGQTQHGNLARDLLATRRAMRKAIRMLDTSNGFLATHGTREVNYVLTRALGARSKHGR